MSRECYIADLQGQPAALRHLVSQYQGAAAAPLQEATAALREGGPALSLTGMGACLFACAAKALFDRSYGANVSDPQLVRSSPQADGPNVFDQVVVPSIMEFTCLRSHEPRLFHPVNAHVGITAGGTTG